MFVLILLVLALACFVIAAVGVSARVNLVALGLAFVTGALIVPLV